MQPEEGPKDKSRSFLTNESGIAVLSVAATSSYDSGLAYGKLLRGSNNEAISFLKNPIVVFVLSCLYWLIRLRARKLIVPPPIIEELKGISAGAGVSYKRLYALNFAYDALVRILFFCSSFVSFNTDGSIIIGHNSDYGVLFARIATIYFNPIVQTVALPGKLRYTHISLPFYVGAMNGFNEAGIAVNRLVAF